MEPNLDQRTKGELSILASAFNMLEAGRRRAGTSAPLKGWNADVEMFIEKAIVSISCGTKSAVEGAFLLGKLFQVLGRENDLLIDVNVSFDGDPEDQPRHAASFLKKLGPPRDSTLNWDRLVKLFGSEPDAEKVRELARKQRLDICGKDGKPIKDDSFRRQWGRVRNRTERSRPD